MKQELITIQKIDHTKALLNTLKNENNNFSLLLPSHLCTAWDLKNHYLLIENEEGYEHVDTLKRCKFETLDKNYDLYYSIKKKNYSLFKQIRRWLRKGSIIVVSENKLCFIDYPFNRSKSELMIKLGGLDGEMSKL